MPRTVEMGRLSTILTSPSAATALSWLQGTALCWSVLGNEHRPTSEWPPKLESMSMSATRAPTLDSVPLPAEVVVLRQPGGSWYAELVLQGELGDGQGA